MSGWRAGDERLGARCCRRSSSASPLLLVWELVVRGFAISPVLLPPPSAIGARIVASGSTILRADVVQTFVKGALSGYVIGCGAGIPDRDRRRSGAVPAPRLAAGRELRLGAADRRHGADHGHVVRLRLAVEGGGRRRHGVLPDADQHRPGPAATEPMQRDLMRTYAAGYGRTL